MGFDPRETDIVIPVMGPTGAGKSSFINELLKGHESKRPLAPYSGLMKVVEGSLRRCTKQIELAPIHHFHLGARIILVDTPGFDDSYGEDQAILEQTANWLKMSYDSKLVLAGVIYLHDISQDRFSGAPQRCLKVFESLCGTAAFDKIIIGTTKHKRVDDSATREEELCEGPWKSMIEQGTRVLQYRDNYNSARAFIDQILDRLAFDTVLEIQQELAVQKKKFPQTKAGQQYIRQQILQIASQRAIARSGADAETKRRLLREEMFLLEQLGLRDVPDSLSIRIRKLFSMKVIRFLQ